MVAKSVLSSVRVHSEPLLQRCPTLHSKQTIDLARPEGGLKIDLQASVSFPTKSGGHMPNLVEIDAIVTP